MKYFANLDNNNKVLEVINISQNDCLDNFNEHSEETGITFCNSLSMGNWIETTIDGSKRKNYAGIGYTYDETRDAFLEPQPYPSWVLDEETCLWESPIPYPKDNQDYSWNEKTQAWDLITE